MNLSFFTNLFVVEGAKEGSVLAFLPFMITALAIGVVLASVYFTVWRMIDARLVKRLYDAGATAASDGKTLGELGYQEEALATRVLRLLLASHACIIYKNVSCDALDAQRLALMKQDGEVSDPEVGELAPDEPSSSKAITEASVTEDIGEEMPKKQAPRRKKIRPRTRIKITPDTRFYILPTSIEYVERHALKVSADDLWGLGFTLAGSVLIWLGALALLDPLVNFLTR